jgi:hypothetical protein
MESGATGTCGGRFLPGDLASFHDRLAPDRRALAWYQVGQSASCFAPDESVQETVRRSFTKDIEPAATVEGRDPRVFDHQPAARFVQLVPRAHLHLLLSGFDKDGDELRGRAEACTIEAFCAKSEFWITLYTFRPGRCPRAKSRRFMTVYGPGGRGSGSMGANVKGWPGPKPAYRRVARSTDTRSFISCVVVGFGYGDRLRTRKVNCDGASPPSTNRRRTRPVQYQPRSARPA